MKNVVRKIVQVFVWKVRKQMAQTEAKTNISHSEWGDNSTTNRQTDRQLGRRTAGWTHKEGKEAQTGRQVLSVADVVQRSQRKQSELIRGWANYIKSNISTWFFK